MGGYTKMKRPMRNKTGLSIFDPESSWSVGIAPTTHIASPIAYRMQNSRIVLYLVHECSIECSIECPNECMRVWHWRRFESAMQRHDCMITSATTAANEAPAELDIGDVSADQGREVPIVLSMEHSIERSIGYLIERTRRTRRARSAPKTVQRRSRAAS